MNNGEDPLDFCIFKALSIAHRFIVVRLLLSVHRIIASYEQKSFKLSMEPVSGNNAHTCTGYCCESNVWAIVNLMFGAYIRLARSDEEIYSN